MVNNILPSRRIYRCRHGGLFFPPGKNEPASISRPDDPVPV
ncbi:hypothetical protein [uncultured Akkermansia sp.]|nr:hypothetical protein [uncultured Akkermansia sp.]